MNIVKKLEMLGIVNIKKLNIESIKKIAKNGCRSFRKCFSKHEGGI